MRRRIRNLGLFLSLLAFATVAGVWVRSYFMRDLVMRMDQDETRSGQWTRIRAFYADNGRFGAFRMSIPDAPPGSVYWRWQRELPSRDQSLSLLGFGAGTPRPRRWDAIFGQTHVHAFVPAWFVLLLTALLPAVRALGWARWRAGSGCCQICGYDLRATLDRCPECGTVDAKAT